MAETAYIRAGPGADGVVPDVIVCGGGVIGLSVAWRARQRGLSVALLDRGPLGAGASHVAAGMLAPVSEADAQERALLALGMEAARRWPAFAAELQDVTGLDVGHRATGTLVVARDRDEAEALDREIALRRRLGIAVDGLLPSEARRLEPALAPTVRAAFLAPDDHQADPRALVAALVTAAGRAGVALRPGVEVASVARDHVVTHSGERLDAGRVVLALGSWSGAPVRPVKGQTVRLRGDHLLDHVVRYEGGYLVPKADGRVILGATQEELGHDVRMTAGGVHDLLRDAAELVPGVLELEIEELIAGLRPGTPDNAPLLGTREDGVVLATGHHRNGILLTPVTADLVVAELLGEPVDHPFTPTRFATRTAAA